MTTFRFYRPGDEEALVALFSRVFGRDETPDWWRWKLLGRRGGPEPVILAEEDGEIVFQVGGVACPAVLDGRDATVMVAVDAMTRPDRRGRGLLTEGYRRLFDQWRRSGVDLVLGMPNEAHGLRARERGWRALFPLRWRVRLLRPERVVARRAGIPALGAVTLPGRAWNAWWDRRGPADGGLELGWGVPDDDEIDGLWARRRSGLRHGPVRDAAWFRWRYLDPPGGGYRLLWARRADRLEGLLSWRVRDEGGRKVAFVAEILAGDAGPGVDGALLGRAVEEARSRDVELVAALAVEGSDRARVLGAHGFLRSWGAFQVACVPLREGLRAATLRDPRAWALEGGVFDVV